MAEEQHNTLTLVPDEMEHRDAYRLMLSVVAPRPIAWISTIGADGTPNLAPYSFFTGASGRPPTLLFSVSPARNKQVKDTLRNVQETGEFVVNLVSEELREAMNLTSGVWPYEVDEFEAAGLEVLPSMDVRPPRVAASPVAMERSPTSSSSVSSHDLSN